MLWMRARQAMIVLTLANTMACVTTKSKTDYVEQGNQYARDGLLREALDSYKKALNERPEDMTARRNLGVILVKVGDYKGASKNLEKSIEAFESNFDSNFYLAEAYRAQEKFAEAIFRYQRALKIRANEPRTLKALAWSFFKIRYYSEALHAAQLLQKIAPNDGQAAIILARTHLKLNDFKTALKTAQSAKGNAPAFAQPYFDSVEGDILFAMGRFADAAQTYQSALREQPLLAGALLGLGRCYMENKNPDKAITYMERAVRIRPRLTEALYMLGKAYEAIDKQKSLRYYAHFRKQAANDPEFLAQLSEVKMRMTALKTGKNLDAAPPGAAEADGAEATSTTLE